MQVNCASIRKVIVKEESKVERVGIGHDNFADTLLDRMNNNKDIYVTSKQETIYYSENYNNLIHNTVQKEHTGLIKSIETERYTIEGLEGGYLRIYDKERKEGFNWKLSENQVQVDKETGTKFLINDWGTGFFNMVTIDAELENGIKEALGVDKLEEKELIGFRVHQDQKTGIKYVTANGYESCGGLLVLDAEGSQKIDSLAKEYLDKYPNIVKSYNEAWFYASFDVRHMVKNLNSGIMLISPNSITFKSMDRKNGWGCIFDSKRWEEVRKEFDSNRNSEIEQWNFWKQFFKRLNIEESRIMPNTSYRYNVEKVVDKMNADLQFQKFRALCFN